MNIAELSNRLQKGEISPVEVLDDCLKRIEQVDGRVQAFVDVEREEAMQAAQESEKRLSNSESLSALDGIPVGIKDNIVSRGRTTQCASKVLDGFKSPYNATVIEKLQAHGMLTLGRLNMDEFAMGSSTENSAIKETRNPHDLERAPGGSSGGSAAAVAAAMVPVALGSDTGGSIRQPASFCGVTGLKPTYGTVSRYGLVAFASSLDQIGPLASTTGGAKTVYDVISGHDHNDSTTLPDDRYVTKDKKLSELRVGVVPDFIDRCDDEVKSSVATVIELVKAEVADVIDVELPHQVYANPVYYLTATSEASANLARFDGVRYGNRPKAESLIDLYEQARSEGFGTEVKRRILLGTFALSSGYYDAYYGKAQQVRQLIRNDYLHVFKDLDIVLMPTSPTTAFKLGEKTADPVAMYASDLLTVGASLAGIPSLSVPGPTDGLPVGVQLQGPFFSEGLLFALAEKIEQAFPTAAAKL